MGLLLFFGCTLISFGPVSSLFALFVCRNPIRQVLFFVATFFALLTVAIASLLWFALSPLTQSTLYTLPVSVLLVEAGRLLSFHITGRVKENFSSQLNESDLKLNSRHVISLVFGVGFGFVSGFISMPVILQQLTGPANFGLMSSHGQYFAVCSSALCMFFTLMNCWWNVVFFEALQLRNYTWAVAVVSLHMLASTATFFNKFELYYVSIPVVLGIFCVSLTWALRVAGVTKQSLYNTLTLADAPMVSSSFRSQRSSNTPTTPHN
ncbi:gamma-secretase subunit Aph-1-like [Symsagittifera roscoffensis]|uniref:gamma-secretase subunit Aph-1-like n=1 Tax=Symsagittifera roscoffensis TaxID=84072 RepID=UPI00307C35FF